MYAVSDLHSDSAIHVPWALKEIIMTRLQEEGTFEDLKAMWQDLPCVGNARNVYDLFVQYKGKHGELTTTELKKLLVNLKCGHMICEIDGFTRRQHKSKLVPLSMLLDKSNKTQICVIQGKDHALR